MSDPKELGIQLTITDPETVDKLLPLHQCIEEHFKETGERSAIFAQIYFFEKKVPPDYGTYIRISARAIIGQEKFEELENVLKKLAEEGAWNPKPTEVYDE